MQRFWLRLVLINFSLLMSSSCFALDQALLPDATINASGERGMAWLEVIQGKLEVRAAIFSSGVWSSPSVLASDNGHYYGVQIVSDNSGNFLAAWVHNENQLTRVQAALYTPLAGWTSPATLSSSAISIKGLSISQSSAGDAVAIWEEGGEVRAAIFQSGLWASPQTLAAKGYSPQVSFGSIALAVWEQAMPSREIFGATWDGTSWSSPMRISPGGIYCSVPDVSVNSLGRGIAVWTQYDGTNTFVGGSFSQGGVWDSPQTLTPVGENPAPSVCAMNDSGESTVVWTGNLFNGNVITKAITHSGVSWSLPTQLSGGNGRAVAPQVAMGGAGEAVALWKELDASLHNPRIFGATLSSGVWGSSQQISPLNELGSSSAVAMNASGESIIVWTNATQGTVQDTFSKP